MQQRRQQSGDGGIAEHDGLQVASGGLDQIRLAIEGVAGKCREARAFGRAVAKPPADQVGQCAGKIVMGEDEAAKSPAEYGVGCRCALRLVSDLLPEGLARRDRSFHHRCRLRCFDVSFSPSDIERRQRARHAPREATSLHARRPGSYIWRKSSSRPKLWSQDRTAALARVVQAKYLVRSPAAVRHPRVCRTQRPSVLPKRLRISIIQGHANPCRPMPPPTTTTTSCIPPYCRSCWSISAALQPSGPA